LAVEKKLIESKVEETKAHADAMKSNLEDAITRLAIFEVSQLFC